MSMNCEKCNGKTKVCNTRFVEGRNSSLLKLAHTRRRLECLECGHRFNTREVCDSYAEEYAGKLEKFKKEINQIIDTFL